MRGVHVAGRAASSPRRKNLVNQTYAPAENLGREEGRYGMHGERRADDPLDQRGAPRTEQVTDHIDHDDARGRKLDVQSPPQTDQHDQRNGQQRKHQFVVHPRGPAQQGDNGMKGRKQVDDYGDFGRPHGDQFFGSGYLLRLE